MTSPPIPTGNISQSTAALSLNEYRAIHLERLLAKGELLVNQLVETLDQIIAYNGSIYPIMSLLEPYVEAIPEIDFHIPPKRAQEVTIEITRQERSVPKIYFDETL